MLLEIVLLILHETILSFVELGRLHSYSLRTHSRSGIRREELRLRLTMLHALRTSNSVLGVDRGQRLLGQRLVILGFEIYLPLDPFIQDSRTLGLPQALRVSLRLFLEKVLRPLRRHGGEFLSAPVLSGLTKMHPSFTS
jgi:hypothetical protein